MAIDRSDRRFKAPRNRKFVAPEQADNVDETDLSFLRRTVAQLDDIWDLQVMEYACGIADSGSYDDYFVARLHLRLVSALAAFDAVYVPAKAAIERRFELALRMSGVSRVALERIASRLPP